MKHKVKIKRRAAFFKKKDWASLSGEKFLKVVLKMANKMNEN